MEGRRETADPIGTLTEGIRVNGVSAKASLTTAGELRWIDSGGGQRWLDVESDVLEFEAEGSKITVKAFVGEFKGPSFGPRARIDFVLEMPTEESALLWIQRLRDCITSLGTVPKFQIP